MDRIVKLLATLDEPIKPRTASEGAKIFIIIAAMIARIKRVAFTMLFKELFLRIIYIWTSNLIPPGADFVDVLEGWVRQCDVFLALIGPGWMRTNDPDTGQRRLDDLNDFVRIEIRAALSRGIPVVPVLLEGASLPPESELPNDIKPLARRNAVRVGQQSFESRYRAACKRAWVDVSFLALLRRLPLMATPLETTSHVNWQDVGRMPPIGPLRRTSFFGFWTMAEIPRRRGMVRWCEAAWHGRWPCRCCAHRNRAP